MTSPTLRQLDLLRFIAGYQRAHGGRSPRLAECADGIGLTTRSSAKRLLDGLCQRGLVRLLPAPSGRTAPIVLLCTCAIPTAPDGAPLHAVFPFHERIPA